MTATATSMLELDQVSPWRADLARPGSDRRFPLWLVLAATAHLLLLLAFYTAPARQLGDPGGSADGVSVSLVTEAEADGRAAVAEEAAGAPSSSIAAPEQQVSPPPTPPAPEPSTAMAATPPQPPPVAQTATETTQETATQTAPALDPELLKLDAPTLPKPAAPAQTPDKPAAKAPDLKPQETKQQEAKPRPTKPDQPKQQQSAKLDLSMPPSMMRAPPGGGGAGVSRPPGTTRSGENDAFFLGVIRALQTSMPQLRDTFGVVTVRIFIDMNGNLVRTEIMTPSGVPGLDQSVVFSTKQASFPFPPRNAVPADLEFRVRYIYR